MMKMIKCAAVAGILTAASTMANADNLTSRDVISRYRGVNSVERLDATVYMLGLGMGYLHASILAELKTGQKLFCFPPKLKIDAATSINVLERFVKENPKAADEDAAGSLAFAFMMAFPCKKA